MEHDRERTCIQTLLKYIILTWFMLGVILAENAYDRYDYSAQSNNYYQQHENAISSMWEYMPVRYMKQSPGVNYRPNNPSDMFAFLRDNYPLPGRSKPLKKYDFIIIGAGSAGCVLANRLSENRNWRVLLLEAGNTESFVTEIPLIAGILDGTPYSWRFDAEPEEYLCTAFQNNTCSLSMGRGVGGSSIINNLIYSRGSKRYWNSIANAGNIGWSFDEVMPYFLKSEKSNLGKLNNSPYHNRRGNMNIEYGRHRTIYGKIFMKAAQELGNKRVDINSGEIGFDYLQLTSENGHRKTSARAFLRPFRNRENLHILPMSRVTKINVDPVTKTARSVEYVRDKLLHKAIAKKEVVVSAGALLSPQILMLSGIGPKHHLEDLNIPVIEDLNVGGNLRDHVMFAGTTFVTEERETDPIVELARLGLAGIRWILKGNGIFALPSGLEALGFINTNLTTLDRDYTDVELLLMSIPINFADNIPKLIFGMDDDFYYDAYSSLGSRRTFTIFPVLLNTESVGRILLRSNNPFDSPVFYTNMLSDEKDVQTMIAAIRYVQNFMNTKAFGGSIQAQFYRTHFSTCYQFEYDTDEYWQCAIKSLSIHMRHYVGTCKMGLIEDPESVVDSQLRIKGVNGLRVVDTSVLPFPPTGHTAASAMMIAEKAADFIKYTWIAHK